MTGFTVRTVTDTVSAVHAMPFPETVRRCVWFVEPTDEALVLGSAQPLSDLDLAEVARRGLATVRRRSGGGAVLVDAASLSWFDVWLPADDGLFSTDVSRSTDWLGSVIVDALASVGVSAQGPVRTGTRTRWSPLVCFAAPGAGEVMVDGRKAVGISQRRSRAGARFQAMVLHRFDPVATAALFALCDADRAELTAVLSESVHAVDVAPGAMRAAIERTFSERWGSDPVIC